MKPIIVALVAVIVWNGLLSGVVLYQRQALLNDEANIGVLSQNQAATHDQLEKVTTVLNRTTKAFNKEQVRDKAIENVVRLIVKFLKDTVDEKPSSLQLNRSNYENVQ